MVGQRGQQRDLLPIEGPLGPVGREQDAKILARQHEWHAADGDQALLLDRTVDRAGVVEPLVARIVGAGVRGHRLGDEAAQTLTQSQPQSLEAGRDRAVGLPHVGVAALGVVEGQVGDVGAEQLPGAAHQRREQRVHVPTRGQVLGTVDQGAQRLLAAAPLLQRGSHAQGVGPGLLGSCERGGILGRRWQLEGTYVGIVGEQPQVAQRGVLRRISRRHGDLSWFPLWFAATEPTQWAVQPPSSANEVPVMNEAAGEHR